MDLFILSQYLIFVRGKYVFGDLLGGEQREGKKLIKYVQCDESRGAYQIDMMALMRSLDNSPEGMM